jgi:hypothetical protein
VLEFVWEGGRMCVGKMVDVSIFCGEGGQFLWGKVG